MATRRVGEKAGLTRERVLDAALDYVDRHGLPALSMRRLGAELGVEAMSLYNHVPHKEALFDALVDRVLETAMAAVDAPDAWLPWMRGYAHALRAAFLAHPGVLPLAATRPVGSAASMRRSERWLGAMRAAGLPLDRAMDVITVLTTFTIGHTLAEAGRTPGHEEAATPAVMPDPAEFPLLAEVIETGAGADAAARFTVAVDLLLAGYAGSG
ncbi:TetR/AcrR family transcriptional regulator C-terminal domain-containing protein [Catenuloplanes atrovinosus]|uniref:AcrR family transcriptional regulator n=1 Tax=Catenuloplanes atrovinosus TaxID=137266 RepID=A0AAE4C8R0_9ACTN|nr:TetR/AcrR family transcriptional regulator C-terminal domain-containing protein [Catenuloplanes atrovinosus]MDR7275786.1 AcrR family transcriptional regulator [Catenuloplanes atrovinosus]